MKKKLLELEMRPNGDCILHVRPHVGADALINMTELLLHSGKRTPRREMQVSALQNAYMEQEGES